MNRELLLDITKIAFHKWLSQNSFLQSAALAYFIILPLPLLLLIILGMLSLIYGQGDAFQAFIQQITTVAGPSVAELFQQLLDAIITPFTSFFASLVALAFTVLGAIGAFGVLQETMNSIWKVTKQKVGLSERIEHKLIPFLLVSVLGFAIMVWTGFSTVLLGFISLALEPFSSIVEPVLRIIQIGLSFILSTVLLAIIYKEVPDLDVQWRDVGLAAIITGLIFTTTNYLFGIILEIVTFTSLTGAAGSILILLPWLFFINSIILYGATLSKVYTEKLGSFSAK
ncbi:MAG: YihY/virulence factor BrkB family protein [Candidatus Bathyarchaeota archaeon]